MTEELDTRLEKFTVEQKEDAERTKSELNTLLGEIEIHEKKLETGFTKLGELINTIQENKFWLLYGDFRSFDGWLKSIESRVKKGRTSLYMALKVAKQLLPYIPPEDLETIGITKASALANAVKKSGKAPDDLLIDAAKDAKVTTDQMQELIADSYGAREEFEKGVWLSLSGVYFNDEERSEFYRAVKVACATDPPLPYMIENWSDATASQRKEILFRWCAEYLSQYEALAETGKA